MTEIARFAKNRREELRITVERYRGVDILNLCTWYPAQDGELRPGRQGLAIRLEHLNQLRAALDAADASINLGRDFASRSKGGSGGRS